MSEKYSKEYLRLIAESLIEDLRECENGKAITTWDLVKSAGYDMETFEIFDLFDIHYALFEAAKANNIKLFTPAHKGVTEGLPFNLEFIVHNKKAQIKCPKCGSKNTARYIYGYPLPDEEMLRKLDAGKLVLGGCCINIVEVNGEQVNVMPRRHCNDCKKNFASVPILITPKKNMAEDYRDIVTSIHFSTVGYFEGAMGITITRNDKGAVVKVKKHPYEDEWSEDKQIAIGKWNDMVNALYSRLYLHEWKKNYVDPCALDGTRWKLDIKLKDRRERHYHGNNDYPPYWAELKEIFQQFFKL